MRSKKRNLLTTNAELAELAYTMHVCSNRIKQTITEINITASYRIQIDRHVRWLAQQARSLGKELNPPSELVFKSKESTEQMAEQLGLFD